MDKVKSIVNNGMLNYSEFISQLSTCFVNGSFYQLHKIAKSQSTFNMSFVINPFFLYNKIIPVKNILKPSYRKRKRQNVIK